MTRTRVMMLLLASMVPPVLGQEDLAIEHLSARPRLRENGVAYDIKVRFTTSAPAIAHVRYGADSECRKSLPPEPELARNHRFDISGVPFGQQRYVHISAKAESGVKASSDVVAVASPAPFPQGNRGLLRVPLTVTETQGVTRREPVTFGIPLPQGVLGQPQSVRLMDGATPVPTSARALLRWPDRTIKWLLVSSTVEVAANEVKQLELRAEEQAPTPPPSMLTVSEDTVVVDTGAARLELDKATGKGALHVDGKLVSALPESRLTAVDGEVFSGHAERVIIEEDNHQRAVISVSGHHRDSSGKAYFGFLIRYFCHAGHPFVRVDHVLRHDIVEPDYTYGDEMKSFASLDLVFDIPPGPESAAVPLEEGRTATLSEGQRLFQHAEDTYSVDGQPDGQRCPGMVTSGGLAVAVRDFWQQWPKSLGPEKGRLVVGLYPKITPGDRYASRPDEALLYYYLRDGSYTFRSGFEKRHELLMGPEGTDLSRIQARIEAPLLVTAAPSWYTSSGTLFGIASDDPAEFAMYDTMMNDGIDDYFAARKDRHWYGLMNFGDAPGGRAHSWRNIEYDTQHGLLTQYFRTGDRRFFVGAEQAARHNADVDVVHYAAGQTAGPGPGRRVGQAWVHSLGHTGGYYPKEHLDMGLYATGYCTNRGHMWNQGNLEYYLLTGDEQVQRSAMQLADWVCGWNVLGFSYGNARVPGWMGIIAMATYFATYDDYYLNGMRLMYEEVRAKGDEKYGLWIHKLGGGHCRCEEKHDGEAGFMAGVLMTALKYFYLATGDQEVAERIVKIATFQVDHLYEPAEGAFHYTSCPKTGVSPILSLIMANGLGFAANYSGDTRLAEVARTALVNGLVAFQRRGPGNSVLYSLPICSAAMAMHEVSRLPGPPLDKVYEAEVGAALNPARRAVPALVPNPDFEEHTKGWVVRGTLELSRSTEVSHSGKAAAKASGSVKGQNEYFVTRYSCGPPWEITWLEKGKDYRLQLWLRVERLAEGVPGPRPRITMRSRGVSRQNFYTNPYDMSRQGTWQLLQGDFTVPDDYDALYIAVSTVSKVEQTDVLMYMDDVTIIPAGTTARDTYVYPTSAAPDAELSGGLKLTEDENQKGWKTILPTNGPPGVAAFAIETPQADLYRVFARVKAPQAPTELAVSIDGKRAGIFQLGKSVNYAWLELTPDAGHKLQRLSAGRHTVTVAFPRDSGGVIQKICLTNELAGR
ncbi:MAG: hypothetical protein HN742_28325 [Lentisphaerae bacterium]|nr:hypothetical protein [Lentisphaerota bacterium]